jgi:prepilin signal peptidase PulO-like enzyme (type II secretory pathway)
MMLMNELIIYIALVLFGLALGSFAGASVWRLRARQLAADKNAGEDYDRKEYTKLKKLLNKKVHSDRSQCLHCGYELRWYDLLPLVSWISLRGKCRSCRRPIGYFEPSIELGVATFFVLSYAFWPGDLNSAMAIAQFGIWLVSGVVMAMLFAYDLKWFLLPDRLTLGLAVLGVATTILTAVQAPSALTAVLSALGAVLVLSGLYAALYVVSKGRWVGFGDVKLGVGLGLLLGDWQLALLALFLANFIGCLIVIPLLAFKKIQRNSRVPFGPMLIAGTVIAWLIGFPILDWYMSAIVTGLY